MLELESNIGHFKELEKSVFSALQTYSNIHRGTGHFSMVTTELFEKAREIVLNYLKLNRKNHVVIFCSPRRSELLKSYFKAKDFSILSSQDINLPLGISAFVVNKRSIITAKNFDTGGGIIKFVSPKSVILSDIPERFEAGTPGIINVICFARALQLVQKYDKKIFEKKAENSLTAKDILYQDDFLNLKGKDLVSNLQNVLVGNDIRVPTGQGLRKYTNLDNAATTPTFLPIWEVFSQVLKSSFHIKQEMIREVKKICSDFLGAPLDDYEVIFTPNTTEAINIFADILRNDFSDDIEPVVVNTLLDHHSNELPWRYTPEISLIRLPVDNEGFLDLIKLDNILREYNQDKNHDKKRIILVSMCGASNVLGSFNDLEQISKITHKYGAQLLVDGAQMVAHRSISLSTIGIDFFAFSAHKTYAPFGSGALIIRKNFLRSNYKTLDKIKASGEDNLVGIATLGKALLLLERIGMDFIEEEERKLTRIALEGLNNITEIEIFGIRDINAERYLRRGGVISFTLKKVPYNLVARELAEYGGIGVRSGCFCAHLLVKKLIGIHPVRQFFAKLYMMFIPTLGAVYLPGLVRMSLGLQNDEDDVRYFLKILEMIKSKRRARIIRLLASTHSGSGFRPHPLIPKQLKMFIETSVNKVYSINQKTVKKQ